MSAILRVSRHLSHFMEIDLLWVGRMRSACKRAEIRKVEIGKRQRGEGRRGGMRREGERRKRREERD